MSAVTLQNPKQNLILAALKADEYSRLLPEMEPVELPSGHVLYEPGTAIDQAYFPTTCIASLISATASGAMTELAITGNEGLIGVPLVLGGDTANHRILVQSAGGAFRVRAEILRWELDQGRELQRLALRYAQVLMAQIAQTAHCNRHHTVEQQLCRWLLSSLDRLSGNQLNMTQAEIANLLGVRREAVAEAAGRLQAAGLIDYSRGRITVLERAGLVAQACECYAIVRQECDRLRVPPSGALDRHRARPNPASLRRQAEARLHQRPEMSSVTEATGTGTLVRELQVSQIEMEIRNEELANAYGEADALRNRFADLYDFAPLAYVSIDARGVICQINLAGAILLGLKRSEIVRHRFSALVSPASQPAFSQFLTAVLGGQLRNTCEIDLVPSGQSEAVTVHIEAIADEDGQECRMIVSDITAQRRSERALRAAKEFFQATLDGLTAHICVLDERGTIIAVNRAWHAFAVANEGAPLRVNEGVSYLAVCDGFGGDGQGEATQFATGLRAVLKNEIHFFELEYPCHAPHEQRWFVARVSRLPGDGPMRVVVAHENITKRKQALQALQTAKNYAENLIRTANVMVVELDLAGNVKLINPAAEQISGYTTDELKGHSWFEALVPKDRYPTVWKMFQEVSSKGLPRHFENPILTKSGEERYIVWQNSELTENGQTVGVVSFGIDMTESRRISQRLEEQDLTLRYAQHIAQLGTWRLNHADQTMTWSDEMFNIYEIPYTAGPVASETWLAVIHPEERERVRLALANSLKTGGHYDLTYRLRLPDGMEKYVHEHSESQHDSTGHAVTSIGVAQDVTVNVLTEQSVRESEIRFRTIVDYTYDWEYWQGLQGEILYINQACQRVSGYSTSEFICRPTLLDEIVHPEDYPIFSKHHHEDIRQESLSSLEFRILSKGGEVRWIWHGCRAVFGADGQPLGRRASNRDITDRKAAEAELEKYRRHLEVMVAEHAVAQITEGRPNTSLGVG